MLHVGIPFYTLSSFLFFNPPDRFQISFLIQHNIIYRQKLSVILTHTLLSASRLRIQISVRSVFRIGIYR